MRHLNIHSLLHSCFYLLTFTFIACQSEVEEVSKMQFVNGNEVVSENAETRSIICEVTTTAAGQLIEKLEEFGTENGCAKEEITELTISGPVNREDLQALQPFEKITKLDMREMTIIDEFGNETTEFPDHSLANFASPAYVYTPNSAYIIRSYAFYNSNIIGVYMHDNTYLLDTGTFNDCKMLTDVRLSDKLEDFGLAIFQGCSSLTSIELPPTLKTIRGGMFAGCGFTTFTIPETVTNIEDGAFQSCENLGTINWPNWIERIPSTCFYNCTNLQFEIPEGVTIIGEYAFSGCKSITSFSLPKTITNIEQGAFRACKNLEAINWPANLTIIPSECFYECTNLKFEIPEYITEIGSYAFAGCTSITSFSLPKTITNIYAGAFQSCENLETINWPASITQIPNFCFNGCSKLQIEIPEGVTDIGQAAFAGCYNIISLPSTLMSIESNAFENCQGITSLTIPPSVTKWGRKCIL
ncbi:MAG: leucine-rich repeat domain-containing protein [Bacteroides sp.]|nr:leucine-rich repeat domain-containing protein [Bacteroides sp.]